MLSFRNKSVKVKYVFVMLLVACLVLTACSSIFDKPEVQSNNGVEKKNLDPVVLYTNDFEDIIGEKFTADTGIPITVVQESGGNLLSRIAAERGNPQWDVLLFDGVGSLHWLDQEGQFYHNFTPANLNNLDDFAANLLPSNHAYFPVGATASALITYRTDRVNNPPQDYFDLIKPQYKGLIGAADPAVAAPAYPAVAWFHYVHGFDVAREFYSGLFENDLQVFRTNGPARRALEAGDIEIAILSSPQAYALLNSDTPIQVIWPETGAPSSSRGVAIQKETKNSEGAQAFIEWMLEPATQQFLTDNAGLDGWFKASVHGVTPLSGGPLESYLYDVAPAEYAATNEAEIKNWFADLAIQ